VLLVVGIEVEEVVDSAAVDVTGPLVTGTCIVGSGLACVVVDDSVDETGVVVEAEPLTEPCASGVVGTGVVRSEETLNRGSGLTAEADAVSAFRNKRKNDIIFNKCY
jgi:hypothetical protein